MEIYHAILDLNIVEVCFAPWNIFGFNTSDLFILIR